MPDAHFRRRLAFVRHVVVTSGFAPTLIPLEGPLNRVFGLVKEGMGITFEFGPSSLERLVSVAEFSEQSVYEKESLRRTATGVEFVLLNPPLRMGAYYAVRVHWDGSLVDPSHWSIAIGDEPARPGREIDRAHPITFPVGVRSRVRLDMPDVPGGSHRVGLEFQNVAIPPRVWMEFHDRVG
jgi:hypothetical protein